MQNTIKHLWLASRIWKGRLLAAKEVQWTRLAPTEWSTDKGAVLNKIEDDQLLVDFSVPANDTYIVHYDIDIDKVSAIRLEANTHDNLPESGPVAANGNFVLSEFNAFMTPPGGEKSKIELGVPSLITLRTDTLSTTRLTVKITPVGPSTLSQVHSMWIVRPSFCRLNPSI